MRGQWPSLCQSLKISAPKSHEHVRCLRARVSANPEAADARHLEDFRHKFLHPPDRQVSQHSLRIGVGFEDLVLPAIPAQTAIVAEGVRFLLVPAITARTKPSNSSNFPSLIVRSTVKCTVQLIMLNSSWLRTRIIVLSAGLSTSWLDRFASFCWPKITGYQGKRPGSTQLGTEPSSVD
jgi:hypothetical protein